MRLNAFLLSILGVSPLCRISAANADPGSCKALSDGKVQDLSDCCSGTLPRTETVNSDLIEISCGKRPDTNGKISRTVLLSAQQCATFIRTGRAKVAAWDPVGKICWYTDRTDPGLDDAPGHLLMKYKGQVEQEDCSARVREAQAECDKEKGNLQTECNKKVEEGKKACQTQCELDKAADKRTCDQEKAAERTKCDTEKGTLRTECNQKLEEQKQNSQEQCNRDIAAEKTKCDTDKGTLRTECKQKLEEQNQTAQEQLEQCRRDGQNHIGNGAWPANDVMTKKRIAATALAYSPTNANQVVTVDFARNIDVYDVTTGLVRRVATMPSADGIATSIAWHPDGQSVLVACFYGAVKVYTVGPPGAPGNSYTLMDEKKDLRVNRVAFSPDGQTAVAGLEDGRVQMWDASSHSIIAVQDKHQASVNSLAFSSKDGTLVTASTDKTIKFWNKGRVVETHPLGAVVRSVAFSPNGANLACGLEDSSIRILDAQTRNQRRDLRAHASAVVDVAFSAEGNALLSASEDRTVRVWSLNGDFAHTTDTDKKAKAIAVSADGKSFSVLFDMRPAMFFVKP
ncbi:WD40-repeat-containing domain protein [Aspergillus pseudocaelatus]|uniref:WD40-repeat-containing domain protein n=1 Tax=Aspergillus pseudocaelatus TaxID=1825620 RepID=A0ABQ6WS94_9EURO|nr:WD40-repeat-containing domain protein [Aspergillus pseudocaelatus]